MVDTAILEDRHVRHSSCLKEQLNREPRTNGLRYVSLYFFSISSTLRIRLNILQSVHRDRRRITLRR